MDKGATIRPGNTTEDLSSALLLGTGVEDLFGNAFGLYAQRTFAAEMMIYLLVSPSAGSSLGGINRSNKAFPAAYPSRVLLRSKLLCASLNLVVERFSVSARQCSTDHLFCT